MMGTPPLADHAAKCHPPSWCLISASATLPPSSFPSLTGSTTLNRESGARGKLVRAASEKVPTPRQLCSVVLDMSGDQLG